MIDRILYNGNIVTLDDTEKRVSALALSGERIVATGSDDEILTLATATTIKQDLAGRTVIPGLVQRHTLDSYYGFLHFIKQVDHLTAARFIAQDQIIAQQDGKRLISDDVPR